jgi:hypothetical protein
MAAPAERQRMLQQLRHWLAAERRQLAWERLWAKRLGLLFGGLIGLFLLALIYLINQW